MGIPWTMEAISYFFEIRNNFTHFMDLVNVSQGILVFCSSDSTPAISEARKISEFFVPSKYLF
jgi:hypothetical protein